MTVSFAPIWRDDTGNRLFLLDARCMFAAKSGAKKARAEMARLLARYGLKADGLVALDLDAEGKFKLEHCPMKCGVGPVAVISGPEFEKAKAPKK